VPSQPLLGEAPEGAPPEDNRPLRLGSADDAGSGVGGPERLPLCEALEPVG
jgi:hypothetical protein